MDVAIDASILVALLNPNDLWHNQAIDLRNALERTGATPVYFDCVAGEAVSTATRRLRDKKRVDEIIPLLNRLETQVAPETLTWILPYVPHLYNQILQLVRSSLAEINFNDALIALACRERGITIIASFDSDFDQISWLRRVATPADLILSNGQDG
jgi:predicted nucleic acid-binding protein